MASNSALIAVKDRGWLNGFGPLWRKESRALWGGWSWLVKIFVWVAIIDGLVAIVSFSSQPAGQGEASPLWTYYLLGAMFPAFGVILFGHEDLIDERKLGTAAWILSKPVSRPAFLLAKLGANALSVLVTMVLAPGIIACLIFIAATGTSLSIPGFLAGLGLVYLFVIFFLALTQMLGTLFRSRGPVIGIPMAVISASFLAVAAPWLGYVMPAGMILSEGKPSLAEALALGQPLPSVAPIVFTVFMVILFIVVAFLRFTREEF